MFIRNFLTTCLLAITFVSCTKTNTPDTNTGNGTAVNAPVTPEQARLLELVNNARASGYQCGNDYFPSTNAVTWNTQLQTAAQKHSDHMNSTGNFSHTGAGNSNAGERISNEGYSWTTYGENIASGYATEEEVIQAWLESPGHCENIMDPDFKEMGVATSGNYWTQVFAAQ